MKKMCVLLITLGILIALPFKVLAATELLPPDAASPESTVDNNDGTVTKTYIINLKTTANESVSTVKIQFDYGTAVKELKCTGINEFQLSKQEDSGANTSVCSYAVADNGTKSGSQFPVARFSIRVAKTASDQDCTVAIGFADGEAVTGETKQNPQTGAMVPYLAIGGCAVLAGVIYVATKKRSLYKI